MEGKVDRNQLIQKHNDMPSQETGLTFDSTPDARQKLAKKKDEPKHNPPPETFVKIGLQVGSPEEVLSVYQRNNRFRFSMGSIFLTLTLAF